MPHGAMGRTLQWATEQAAAVALAQGAQGVVVGVSLGSLRPLQVALLP